MHLAGGLNIGAHIFIVFSRLHTDPAFNGPIKPVPNLNHIGIEFFKSAGSQLDLHRGVLENSMLRVYKDIGIIAAEAKEDTFLCHLGIHSHGHAIGIGKGNLVALVFLGTHDAVKFHRIIFRSFHRPAGIALNGRQLSSVLTLCHNRDLRNGILCILTRH